MHKNERKNNVYGYMSTKLYVIMCNLHISDKMFNIWKI